MWVPEEQVWGVYLPLSRILLSSPASGTGSRSRLCVACTGAPSAGRHRCATRRLGSPSSSAAHAAPASTPPTSTSTSSARTPTARRRRCRSSAGRECTRRSRGAFVIESCSDVRLNVQVHCPRLVTDLARSRAAGLRRYVLLVGTARARRLERRQGSRSVGTAHCTRQPSLALPLKSAGKTDGGWLGKGGARFGS